MNKRFGVKEMILAALFAALMVVGAKIKIDLPFIALTFQPFFAVLAGLLLGSFTGLLSQIVYILMGLVGLPVFAGSSAGLQYITQPSFGFILAFALAAFVVGLITEKHAKIGILRCGIASAIGLIIIYVVGILYFFAIKNLYLGTSVGLFVIAKGMLPFFLKDAVMFALASVLASRLLPVIGTRKVRAATNI